ncbi:murein hydrolase activator EnvC family protein [Chitinimonas sp. PSY-7]|uniref:peptidoglycan DD-metalloendopeptidase family protein n=1 Tax=Chitinimonas sp. PSY-7 TaxID=3459088 RepID=UPI0040403E22
MISRLLPLFAAVGLLASAAWAAQPEDDLQDLRRKIDSLKQELQANEATRHDAADALKSSEHAISEANRAVARLNREQQLSEAAMVSINQDIVKTRENLESNRQRLQDLIRSRHRNGQHEALRLLLNRQDPNKLARDLRYYRYIAQAQYKLSGELAGQLEKLNELAEVLRQKHEALLRIAAERKAARDQLRAEQAQKQEVLSKIAGEIGEQRKQISKLQRDEKRLTQLVEKINRMIREREIKEAREREKQARAQRLAEAREAARLAREAKSGKKPSEPVAKPEAVVKRNEALPDSTADGRRFAELKGQLRLPARGEVTGKFGSPRSEGTQWKGVFIRTTGGQSVKVVASGQVVFADWLRGFGNMLIVDHGGGYLSLYGAAESLMKQVGDKVVAGEDIATSGNSGGSEQTGIYFEIRHLGKPLDPLAWAKG